MRITRKRCQTFLERMALALSVIASPIAADPVIGIAFPPAANKEHRDFSISALKPLNIEHIRIADTWARRGLNPDRSDFAPLVRRISEFQNAGIKVILTIELDVPRAACSVRGKFACDIDPAAPFENYLRVLIASVGDQIDALQIANEWDNHFPGDADAFLRVYGRAARVIRAERPELTLVLGGITGAAPYAHAWCAQGLSPAIPGIDLAPAKADFCGKQAASNARKTDMVEQVLSQADYDVVDIHLYDAPGLWSAAVGWVQARSAGRPVWVTEFGGPQPEFEPRDPEYQAARLVQYLNEVSTLPVARAYYFKLTDDPGSYHGTSGLYDRRGRAKPALSVFSAWRSDR